MSDAVENLSPEKIPTDFNKTLCFGSILQTFISGWDETECTKVITHLLFISEILKTNFVHFFTGVCLLEWEAPAFSVYRSLCFKSNGRRFSQ